MYTPKDFNPEKMHSLKYLWIFERRAELIAQQLDGMSMEERVEKLPVAFLNANELVQMETGLTSDELTKALFVGTYIAEYRLMETMDLEEKNAYIEFIEEDSTEIMSDLLKESLEKLSEALDPSELRSDFNEIIKENFNETE